MYLGGCAAIALGMAFVLLLIGLQAYATLITGTGSNKDDQGLISPEGLSDMVPPVFASLFTEAGQKSGVAPAMVAAIYLTEHHTSTFGKDLPSTDYALDPCTENSSGAAGPMQFIPSSWNGVVDNLKSVGIENPDRCKYRDSIIGAAFLLRGKLKFDWVQAACKTTDLTSLVYSDDCISRWGQSYCGVDACDAPACGGTKYRYCEQVVIKYHLVEG